jgi:CBS domain-containing protein
MICPACGYENLPGRAECAECVASLMQEDVPMPDPDMPLRWRIMVDPIDSLEKSSIPPQMISSGACLADAIRQMQEMNVGYLLVTNAQDRLQGIFTEHALLKQVAGQITDLQAHRVDEFMSSDFTTLSPAQPISHALHHMGMDDFMYIPLVDDQGRPQDLLSFRRVCRLIDQME